MVNQHAVTYREKISITDLEYLIKKSNKLGRMGKAVIRVYQQEDREGTHIYFEVSEPICA